MATVTGTRYTDLTVDNKQPCSYEVAALNRSGLEGPRSAALAATAPNNPPTVSNP